MSSPNSEDAKLLELNQKFNQTVEAGAPEQWLFEATKGQTVIFQVKHRASALQAVLRNARGVELFHATSTREAKGIVFAYELPNNATYSLWITILAGGAYTLRAFDADQ
jgi:hypothetical protein